MHLWHLDPGLPSVHDLWGQAVTPGVFCPLCGCPLQRLATGSVMDGVAAHYRVVHPGHSVPEVVHGER